jgi:hypothetical protein
MKWYHYISYFFGGAFLANAVPHFTNGISGRAFPTPFATPPGQGMSPPLINVLWGMFNLIIGYLLVWRVGRSDLRRTTDALLVGAGILLMGVMLARAFGPLYSGG